MPLVMSLFVYIHALLAVGEGLHTRGRATANVQVGKGALFNEAYTFDEFVQDFARSYEAGSEEYLHRAAIFQDSLLQIHAKNSRAGRSWTAGVHPFMDWTDAERTDRLHGYAPSLTRRVVEPAPAVAKAAVFLQLYGGVEDSFEAEGPAVRNQGGLCGSCWAFAAVESVEARLMKANSPSQLSVQALLDCVPNPKHCGGTGGCGGANPDQAFDFMRDNGVPLETDLPYSPKETGKCPLEPYPSGWGRVTLTGWQALPRNQAQPVMQAIVNDGPVVVAIDATDWYPYHYGVYDGCHKDAIPNHSVLVRGYGADEGKKYWLIQNSWGAQWGEQGSIRLLRHDNEDQWCGVDTRPQQGFACDDGAKQNVTVCGNCGLLIDPIIPQVGRAPVQFSYPSAPPTQSFQADQFSSSSAPTSSGAAAETLSANAASVEEWRMPQVEQGTSDQPSQPGDVSDVSQVADSERTRMRELFDVQPADEKPLAEEAPVFDASDVDMADVLPKEELNQQFSEAKLFARVSANFHVALNPDAEGLQPPVDAGPAARDQAKLSFGSDADSLIPGWRSEDKTPMDAYLRR